MPGLSDLTGRNGVIEQLLLWNVASQVVSAMLSPAWAALQQDALKAHPDMVLTPDVLAQLAVRHLVDTADAKTDAAKSGIDGTNFDRLMTLATQRIQPADLAEAVLRSYMTEAAALDEARPQGIGPERFKILTDLAGDGIGPEQAAEALRRKLLPKDGTGADAVSYTQAIAESRLHNKWGETLYELTRALLSPPDAAEAVVRGFLARADGESVAALSGVDKQQFAVMVDLAGDAPGPEQLAEALRRGAIPRDSGSPDRPGFIQGIREGRLADRWAPMIEQLAQIWPTPVNALDALLKGQVTADEGKKLYERLGGAPEFFQVLFDTQGEAPSPLELIAMANRRYIPWDGLGAETVSYEQGFKEGRWRNKWEPVYKQFAEYLPPESTVITLLAHNVLTNEQAAPLLAKQGMSDELIKAYLAEAHTEALTDYRGATISVVTDAYYAQLITRDDAKAIIEAMHVTPEAADLYLGYTDIKRSFAAIGNAVSRVRSLYAARKITASTAKESLLKLEIPAKSVTDIMESWALENSISVKTLTATQIIDAWAEKVIDNNEAMIELENIGYTPFDAWVLMSTKAKAPQPDKPAQGPAAPQSQVIAGTT